MSSSASLDRVVSFAEATRLCRLAADTGVAYPRRVDVLPARLEGSMHARTMNDMTIQWPRRGAPLWVLGHELAHVSVGLGVGHSPAWEMEAERLTEWVTRHVAT